MGASERPVRVGWDPEGFELGQLGRKEEPDREARVLGVKVTTQQEAGSWAGPADILERI